MADTLKGKVVIVTGASSGIGAATVAAFEALGASIVALDIRASGQAATATRLDIACNVSSEAECNAAVKQAVDKFGTIDVLCNVAGIMDEFGGVAETSDELFQKVFNVNVLGPLHTMRAVIPVFQAKSVEAPVVEGAPPPSAPPTKGVIVNVGSVASIEGATAGAAYTTSKHALLGLTRNTVALYKAQGIRTNIVFPGGVATNIMANSGVDHSLFGTANPALLQKMGLGTGAMPAANIASAIVYLATGPGLNGVEMTVDDGWSSI